MPRSVMYGAVGLALLVGGVLLAIVLFGDDADDGRRLGERGAPAPATGSVERASPTSDTATYTSDPYGFSVSFPSDLAVTEYVERGGARTITFENGEKVGFQVFILPYRDTQIAQSRILLDTKGTAELPPQEAVIAGSPALIFWSTDPLLGRLREVWFIRNGYLYEVTAYASLDSWLAGVMRSWQFR